MKQALAAALAAVSLVTGARAAGAQAHGQFTAAAPLPLNGRLFGAYLVGSENVIGLVTQLRLSFHPGIDFGFQGGLSRLDVGTSNRTLVRLGTDLKVATARADERLPVDASLGGWLGVDTGEDYNVLRFGPVVSASRTFASGGGLALTPYASFGLTFARYETFGQKDTDFSLPMRVGAELQLAPELRVMGEFHLNFSDRLRDDVGFAAGVNLPF